jgi:hypothetical protein
MAMSLSKMMGLACDRKENPVSKNKQKVIAQSFMVLLENNYNKKTNLKLTQFKFGIRFFGFETLKSWTT